MTDYTIHFPEPEELGNQPPYAAIMKVLELVATQEDAVGRDEEEHSITFLTSMHPEVIDIRLSNAHWYHPQLRTRHIVAKWCNGGFTQYLIWDGSKQDIVDMVEA